MIFIIDGLPCSDKSEALTKLLQKVILKSRSDALTKVSEKDERAGISYYELAAVGLPPAPFDRLTYSETTKHTYYLYAFQSALKHLYYSRGQEIIFDNPSTGQKEIAFNDPEMNDHFDQIFRSLAQDQSQTSQTSGTINWKRSIPNGIALINVWDIGMNKAVYYFLPALWGHLHNSYLWLFLNIDRDAKELYNVPHLPENMFCTARNDKKLIMRYRSRIEYLLRPAMLAKSISSDREDVCTLFGAHSGTYNQTQLDGLVEEIRNASAQAYLATVVNTKEVIPINPKNDKCWEILKRKADEIIGAKLESTIQIPLASIFLRSLYYGVDKMYIRKSELKAKAELLNITDDEFEKFCQVFTSFGSIIDISLIDKSSDYIILQPTVFIRCLNKVFYPDETDSRVAMFGIITKSTAMEIFNTDHEFFMDVLVSVDLAVRLESHQITIESIEDVKEDIEYYYIPDVRTTAPNLECRPSALHLLYSTNSPLRHLQVLFARALLKIKTDSQLVFKNASPVNITTFKTFTIAQPQVAVNFEMRYLGEAVQFRVPPEADSDICAAIIRSCHDMMKSSKFGYEKYNFAFMCSKDPNPNTPSRLRRMRHLLPNKTLCEACIPNEMLSIWNATLEKVSSLNCDSINNNNNNIYACVFIVP